MTRVGPFDVDTVVRGDCTELLQQLPDHSVDLIFADPPYNLQIHHDLYRPNFSKVGTVMDEWDRFDSIEAYDQFCKAWLQQCYRVLKATGSIWVIGTYHNIFRVGAIMQDLDFWLLNDVVWIKCNPMPNFKGTRFSNAHETLIWAVKSHKAGYTFHYQSLKTMNDDLQMRSDWVIPICGGHERIRINGTKAHSTQKPEALLYRVLLATSNPGDLVLDLFSGSGTTAAVARRLGRRFLAFERNPFYVQLAQERLQSVQPLNLSLLSVKTEKRRHRVSFGKLIESGYVQPGERLFSKDAGEVALVLADASLVHEQAVGSIHKVSAALLHKETNNGWTYWYVKRNEELVSIDLLRQAYEERFSTLSGNGNEDYTTTEIQY